MQTKNDEKLAGVVMVGQKGGEKGLLLREQYYPEYDTPMPVSEQKPIYVRGKVTRPQKQAVAKRCQDLDLTESQFVRRCIREHFEKYAGDGIVWPVSKQDGSVQ